MSMSDTPRIVAVGDLTVDLVMPVTWPVEPGQSQEVGWHTVEPGGAGNFLIAGQRLGAQMFSVGAIGSDLYGRYVLDVLTAEGVNVQGVSAAPGSTSTVVLVLSQPETGQFAYIWRGGQADPVPVTDKMNQIIEQADALFMQGYTLCEQGLRPLVERVFASGKRLWFDVGPAIVGTSETDRALARQHVYALTTTEEELPLIAVGRADEAACDFLLGEGLQLIVVKRGARGCRIITPDSRTDVPAFPVVVRDLVGAGDCFNAAFIYGTLRGLSLVEAATLANAAGGAKVQNLGTGRAMPTRDEVMAVLSANGISLKI
jgi:sugar/nucleoside kinase (ribokinase family)